MTEPDRYEDKKQRLLHDRVAKVIDRLRPMMQADGGDMELLRVADDGVVHVRLQGACVGCPSAAMTLSLGIERNLKLHIPEVRQVVCESAGVN